MYEFEINGIKVGRNQRPYVLAEIGINHEGDVKLAERLIRAAKKSGADGVKFQTFKAEDLAHPEKAPEYYKLFKSVELDEKSHRHLKTVAENIGIAFISTPFGIEEATFLKNIGVPALKIASGDMTNYRLLRHVAGLGLPIILSTGMSFLDEVRDARKVLIDAGCKNLVILHCVSRYPTVPEELDLMSIKTMVDEFPEVIGFSDHTEGTWAAPAAVALGARFIEKHFTIDKTLPGPDHVLSASPDEMKSLVEAIWNVYYGLGDGSKKPCPMEFKNRHLGRKGLYASRNIKAGSKITNDDIKLIRPEGEIRAVELDNVVGKTINANVSAGEEIRWDVLSGENPG